MKTIKSTVKKNKLFKFGETFYPKMDATASLVFELKKEDVINGIQHDPNSCALACAIKRTYGDVHVTRTRAMILKPFEGKIYAVRYILGATTQKQVAFFDKTKSFAPGIYKLNPPKSWQTIDVIYKKKTRNKVGKVPRKPSIGQYLRLKTPAI